MKKMNLKQKIDLTQRKIDIVRKKINLNRELWLIRVKQHGKTEELMRDGRQIERDNLDIEQLQHELNEAKKEHELSERERKKFEYN